VKLHLSEVKGPVMDALQSSPFLSELTGRVFLSQNDAFATLIRQAEEDDAPHPPEDLWLARGLI
jgi:SulP family sulfate permease